MKLEKKYKPTFHKANARYRGVTELGQYSNFVLESAHDLVHLHHILNGHTGKGIKGQTQEIGDNFKAIMGGEEEVGNSTLFTAATLNTLDKERKVEIPSLENWQPLNQCIIQPTKKGVILESKGLKDPVGIYTPLYVESGQQLYMRLKVKSATGAPSFSFGSNNKRTGPSLEGDVKPVFISRNQDYLLVDHILTCKYTETIHLNINVHQFPEVLNPESIEIEDFEIYYLNSSDVHVMSMHEELKPTVNRMYEQLYSIQ